MWGQRRLQTGGVPLNPDRSTAGDLVLHLAQGRIAVPLPALLRADVCLGRGYRPADRYSGFRASPRRAWLSDWLEIQHS
jgi:hypothetical protein